MFSDSLVKISLVVEGSFYLVEEVFFWISFFSFLRSKG